MELSVLIRAYNSAPWLPDTLTALARSLEGAGWKAEVVVVDDGSTDETHATAQELGDRLGLDLRVVRQTNQGRFLAGWTGAQEARGEHLLILDSRVHVAEGALRHLRAARAGDTRDLPWNGHVTTAEEVPLVGRFWEVPTHVFWSEYLANPRPIEIDVDNFDRVPKGIGFFFIRRQLFIDACRATWPEGESNLVSDDTKLLRHIVAETPIRLDPDFAAVYLPRVSVPIFLSHAFDRGTLFVDSYGGTSRLRNVVLLALAIAPPVVLALIVGLFAVGLRIASALLLLAGLAGTLVPAVLALRRRCSPRAVLSYIVYILPFGGTFWAGLLRGTVVHRRLFRTSTPRKGMNA